MPGAVFVWNLLVFCSEFLNKVKLRSKLVKQNNNVLKCVEKINWFCAAREWNSRMTTVGWCKSFYLYQQIQIFLSSWKMSEKTQSICLLITSLLLFVNLLNVERILGEKWPKRHFFQFLSLVHRIIQQLIDFVSFSFPSDFEWIFSFLTSLY